MKKENNRAFILYMFISYDKVFPMVSKYLFLWSWPSLEDVVVGNLFVFQKHILFDLKKAICL